MEIHDGVKAATWFLAKVAICILGAFAVFWFGYIWIADYGDGVASGTYEALVDGQKFTLLRSPDHTFRQTRVSGGVSVQAKGTWRRVGEGGLVFSETFLAMPHQDTMSDGTTYGALYKTLGIWPPYISLASSTRSPIFKKRLFAWSKD